MKQSLEDYIEGRMQLGGCGLFALIVVIAIIGIGIAVKGFIDDFTIKKLLKVIFWVGLSVLIMVGVFKGKIGK
jgi:hypothetical protein